jgi:hypothetical protein
MLQDNGELPALPFHGIDFQYQKNYRFDVLTFAWETRRLANERTVFI